ncbi:MAG: hypothetical protein SWO11_15265 [Thermodesulfobacteriota bacterium]|nr:hypothetical protein [Thermodesulfobacteriota bacterium]
MGNDKPFEQNSSSTDSIIQDGIACPRKPPWDPKVSKITALPFLLIVVLAIHVLFQAGIIKLIIWLLALAIFAYPLRYLICARCPYYGTDCSSIMGRLVPKLFKKQEGKSMVIGLWLDIVFFIFLFAYPLPYIWRIEGLLFIVVWCIAFFLAFIVLTRLACSICPFTFCPIGKAGRAFWRDNN